MSALSAYKVLELSEGVAGEYCGKLLSDFGADVIKIEKPGSGSPTRRMGPFGPGDVKGETSGLFAFLNTNKSSVAVDLSTPAGAATLKKLLERVDVVIDDHAPGWLASIGLDPKTLGDLHPRLVVCSITPYGQSAPDDRKHAEDLNVFHASGWGYHTPSASDPAKPPLKGPGRFLTSYEAGLESAMCVVSCLYARETTKRGEFIDISKQEVLLSRVDYVMGQMIAGDMDVTPARTAFDLWGPASIFDGPQGYTYLWISRGHEWKALGELLGHPEWMKEFPEKWLEFETTPERVAKCREDITKWLKTQNRDEATAKAQKLGLTWVPVNSTSDLMASPQYVFRKFFDEVSHPVLGSAIYPTVPYQMTVTPAKIKSPAPLLGQHTEQKLAGGVL